MHRAIHGRWSLWPLLSFFFLYNRIFLGGMVNYLFTLGLSRWACAAWIYFRERPFYIRAVIAIPISLLLLRFHLAAFGVYALFVAGYEISLHLESSRKWYAVSVPDMFAAGIQFAAALAVMLILSSATGNVSSYQYNFLQKLNAPLNLFYNYNLAFDIFTFLFFGALSFCRLLWLGWISISRRMLLSIALVVFGFVAMPYEMLGSFGADRRLTVAIALLTVSASDWKPELIRWRRALLVGLGGLFVIRMAIVAGNWLMSDQIYKQYLAAFEQLPPGARLAVVIAHNSTQTTTNPPINFIAQYAIIKRDAFVDNTYTTVGQQPLSFTPEGNRLARQFPLAVYEIRDLRNLSDPSRSGDINPFSCARASGYDAMIVAHEADFPMKPPGWLVPIASGTDFRLFKILPCT